MIFGLGKKSGCHILLAVSISLDAYKYQVLYLPTMHV